MSRFGLPVPISDIGLFGIVTFPETVHVFKILKWLFILAFVLAIAGAFWVVFALWTGIYTVYTYPPSKEHPDGVTYLLERDEGEPIFNSPAYTPPPKTAAAPSGGMSFGSIPKAKRPLERRTVLKLPYVDWAYQKSLEKPEPEKK
jgi:hypothetical protein